MTTELELAHQRIEQLQRQVVQGQLAMEDFTYSVAHDLRASLRHVNAYLKIVREDLGDGLDDSIASHLDTAGDAAAHMARLMDGLMELSRVGRAELQLSDVDLSRLVDDFRSQLESDPPNRRIEWRVALDLPKVRGDIALLGQLLESLLSNALKFTRECPLAEIDIGWTRHDEGTMTLHIRDNGIGFDARYQDRLFRIFQRLHSAKRFDGIGVGLALARRVVERHGGTIWARGDMGPGCQISLTLPVAGAVAAEAGGRRICSA